MSKIFNGEWWSVQLPAGWQVLPEERGASFFRTPRVGTLQVSAARKSKGDVSDDDLREFAAERLTEGHQLHEARHLALTGFQCTRSDENFCWNEWWLKHGSLMIYATYVVPREKGTEIEKQEVIGILGSLAAR